MTAWCHAAICLFLQETARSSGYHVSDTFFSRDLSHLFLEILHTFTGMFLRLRRSEYSFSVGGTFLSYNRSYGFFKNRSFGGVEPLEGLENAPDILTQNFLEIRILTATGAGSDQRCSAEPKWTNFSRQSSKQGSEPAAGLPGR